MESANNIVDFSSTIYSNRVFWSFQTGFMLTDNLYHQLMDPSNKVDNLEHLMCTIGLVALEMGAEEVCFTHFVAFLCQLSSSFLSFAD
ncbi:unnamed protein product [Dibothriocephalus latus]|uniref:Uncharacterized protein n=1 Tax=Dibothriocephalus latus TaxID=60516 RepID=A0A3P7RJL2_DIBLA|nr:unnamed protein product [Dibothriocephalus latus]